MSPNTNTRSGVPLQRTWPLRQNRRSEEQPGEFPCHARPAGKPCTPTRPGFSAQLSGRRQDGHRSRTGTNPLSARARPDRDRCYRRRADAVACSIPIIPRRGKRSVLRVFLCKAGNRTFSTFFAIFVPCLTVFRSRVRRRRSLLCRAWCWRRGKPNFRSSACAARSCTARFTPKTVPMRAHLAGGFSGAFGGSTRSNIARGYMPRVSRLGWGGHLFFQRDRA